MISFKTIGLEDKAWMDKLMKEEDSRSADFNFSNFYLWKDTYKAMVAQYQGRLIAKVFNRHEKPVYFFPAGSGDLSAAIEAMARDAARFEVPLMIWGVTPKRIKLLEERFPGKFQFTPNDYAFDYVYSVQKLSDLSGKRLHAKRNHINKFEVENRDWMFEPISKQNLCECENMNKRWADENFKLNGRTNPEEQCALKRAFDHFEYLKLEGGLLRAEGEVVAFTIGEKQNSDTYTVHFEKAFSEIRGAYPMINREFAKYVREKHPEIVYINREDDMGMENLRKAKRSYYPDFMVEKYTAVLQR